MSRVVGKIGLTDEQRAARAGGIGGSDATIIASGDAEKIQRLVEEKRGEREAENLDWVIPVMFGNLTEEFNLDLFERQTGLTVSREGESVVDAEFPWRRCTLDGMASDGAVVQAKCVNAFAKPDDVVQKYMGQVHHEMDVCGTDRAYLTVFIGTMKWDYWLIERNAEYAARLFDLEVAVWQCVQTGEPWPGYEAPTAPVAPTELREIDMAGSNEWGAYAADWLDNRVPAKAFEKSAKALKGLVEPDVGRAHGHGIEIKRSKAGALSIKEMKA